MTSSSEYSKIYNQFRKNLHQRSWCFRKWRLLFQLNEFWFSEVCESWAQVLWDFVGNAVFYILWYGFSLGFWVMITRNPDLQVYVSKRLGYSLSLIGWFSLNLSFLSFVLLLKYKNGFLFFDTGIEKGSSAHIRRRHDWCLLLNIITKKIVWYLFISTFGYKINGRISISFLFFFLT